MKRYVALMLILFVGAASVLAAQKSMYSRQFMNNFKDCTPYSETVNSSYDGKSYIENREIVGWNNGMCFYRISLSTNNDKYEYDCVFSNLQMEELYNAMKSRSKENERYSIDLFTPYENQKNGEIYYKKTGYSTISGSKAYVTWVKYQSNPYFCRPRKK